MIKNDNEEYFFLKNKRNMGFKERIKGFINNIRSLLYIKGR